MPWQPLARWNSGAAFFTPASNSASMPGLTSIWAISVITVAPPLGCGSKPSSSERSAKDAEQRRTDDQKRQQRRTPARRFDVGEQRQSGERHDGGERQVV